MRGAVPEPSPNLPEPSRHLSLGSVVEWRLTGAEAPGTGAKTHPYHQHMTHFQVVDVRMQGPAKAEHAPRRGLAKL